MSWLHLRARLQYRFPPGFPSPSTALQLTPAQSDDCPVPQQLGALLNLSALGQHIPPPSRAMLGLLKSFARRGGHVDVSPGALHALARNRATFGGVGYTGSDMVDDRENEMWGGHRCTGSQSEAGGRFSSLALRPQGYQELRVPRSDSSSAAHPLCALRLVTSFFFAPRLDSDLSSY